MAADEAGEFVVIWRSRGGPGPDTSNYSARLSRYAGNQARGEELLRDAESILRG